MPVARGLSPEELDLLAAIAARKIPGPVARTRARERLQKLRLIEARKRDLQEGQTASWFLTEAGIAELRRVSA